MYAFIAHSGSAVCCIDCGHRDRLADAIRRLATGRINPGSSSPTGAAKYLKATYIGRDACIECHEQEHKLWLGSHHDLAMQVANEDTVLGDFNDVSFTHFGVTSRFYKKDGKFFVNTDGPDGQMHDYEIIYTFGVTPLQQYLIEFPDGRVQSLGICWDARPKENGGQRWYHLYADEPIPYNDELHWTGPNQNWNYMCAECHSTRLRKNYDLKTNTYNTTWYEINVSCEACHGPSSNHVRWAKEKERGIDRNDPTMGMAFQMTDDGGTWEYPEGEVIAKRSKPREDRTMMHMCARCHSRRSVTTEDYEYGHHLLDTHRLSLLDEGLYFPDGQIQDEVYVIGSFLQSKMYQSGVTCTDCHDPHSMQRLIPGNNLCSQCHLPKHYDTPKHHFHEQDGEGSLCTDCHMPTRTYMGVDDRFDHSFRIPRPDLSILTGSPNACNNCHDDQTYEWSENALDDWYGKDRSNKPHYGHTIHAARTNAPSAAQKLLKLIEDDTQPGIVRATALSLAQGYPSETAYHAIQKQVQNADPLIRFGALNALESYAPIMRLQIAYDLLDDPITTVRDEAARLLAPMDPEQLTDEQKQSIEKGIEGYIASQLANAERAESHLNIALVYVQQGKVDAAEQSYKTAIRVNPNFAQAYVNLADLYRTTGRDELGMEVLQNAIDGGLKAGVLQYAMGLAMVRQGNAPEAINAFKLAAELTPEDPQFGYTLGIALNSTGQPVQALAVLADNHERHPKDLNTLTALMTINRDQQKYDDAIRYANILLQLNPPNPDAIKLFIQQLERQKPQ